MHVVCPTLVEDNGPQSCASPDIYASSRSLSWRPRPHAAEQTCSRGTRGLRWKAKSTFFLSQPRASSDQATMSLDAFTTYLSTPDSAKALLLVLAALNIPLFLLWQINDRPSLRRIIHPTCPKNHIPQYLCRLETSLLMHTVRCATTSRWRLSYTTSTSLFSHRDPHDFLFKQAVLLIMALTAPQFPELSAFRLLSVALGTIIASAIILSCSRHYRGLGHEAMEEMLWCWLACMTACEYTGPRWHHICLRGIVFPATFAFLPLNGLPLHSFLFAFGGDRWTEDEVRCWLRTVSIFIGAMGALPQVVRRNPVRAVEIIVGLLVRFAMGPM